MHCRPQSRDWDKSATAVPSAPNQCFGKLEQKMTQKHSTSRHTIIHPNDVAGPAQRLRRRRLDQATMFATHLCRSQVYCSKLDATLRGEFHNPRIDADVTDWGAQEARARTQRSRLQLLL